MLFRFAGSFLVACLVVSLMLLVAVRLWGGFEGDGAEETLPEAHPIDLLVGYDSLDVAELFGEPRRRLPELEAPPPAILSTVPGHRVDGFVQIEVEVDASGSVTGARVLESTPAGIYEDRALAIVSEEKFPAGQPGTRIRVIDFSAPSAQAR